MTKAYYYIETTTDSIVVKHKCFTAFLLQTLFKMYDPFLFLVLIEYKGNIFLYLIGITDQCKGSMFGV